MNNFILRLQKTLPPEKTGAKIIVSLFSLCLYWLVVWLTPLFLFGMANLDGFRKTNVDFARKFIEAIIGFPYWYALFLQSLIKFDLKDLGYYFFLYFFVLAPLLSYFYYRFLKIFFKNGRVGTTLFLAIAGAIFPMIYIFMYILSNVSAPKF